MLKFTDFINESFNIGQDVYVMTKDGRIVATIKKIKGQHVYWSNEKGQMGMSTLKDVIVLDKSNLTHLYFKSSPKLTKFLVPFEVLHQTEKAYLLGYKNGKIWVPKKNVYDIIPGVFSDIPGVPKDGYWISYNTYYDDDKKEFFENYATYIHNQKKKDAETKYKFYKQQNDKLLDDLQKVANHLYNLINKENPDLEWLDFDTYKIHTLDAANVNFKCWNRDIQKISANIDSFKFDLKPENVKNDTLERKMFLTILAKKLKNSNYKKLLFELEKEYHNLDIKRDDSFMFSDDARAYKYGSTDADLAKKLETFIKSLK